MPDRSLFTEKIKSIYDKLDTQQREAVDKVEGPVMVIGGPGTGKTHIMSIRVAKILLTADTTPGNILCLADTDDGVVTLRKSLLRLIGPDAYKVNIHTCYSFCEQIIQDNLSCFNKNEIDLVSELEKIELFKKLVDTFPKHHRLKRFRGDVYYEIGNLRALFTAMKQEGWSQHFINDKIDEYINDLPKRDEYVCKTASSNFKKGEVRTDDINGEIEKVEKLRAAVNEFDRFQQLMISRNRYDYDDIINWVVKAFRDFPALLISYQKQFQYFLVDDYQNLSGAQHELVQLLANPNAANIFVTGDEDQCINNHGCIHNFLSFVRHYKDELLLVELTNNYRSVQAIVNLAQSLIKNNLCRLTSHIPALRKELSCHDNRKNIDDSERVVIREYATEREEKIHITLEVEGLLKQGVSPNAICIIYNESSYGEELEMFFAARKIPFNSKRKINVLETPLVKKIVLFLNYLAVEHDVPYGGDEMLFQILHFDFFQIPAIEIAKLSVEVADKKFTTERTSIRRLLTEKATRPASKLFENRFPESLQKASAIIEKLIGEVPNSTLANLVEKMVRETGLLAFILKSNDKHVQLQTLTALLDFIKEETKRNPFLTLLELADLFELMRKEGFAIPLRFINGTENGVNLLTPQDCKGLEYEYVFIAGVNAQNWEKKKKFFVGYSFPDTMFISNRKNNVDEQSRRSFYVALTRGQKQLHISYSRFKDDLVRLEASRFISEIQEKNRLPIEAVSIDTEIQTEFTSLFFRERVQPEVGKLEEELVGRLLSKFVMNVSALNNYLKCPLDFYFHNLVRVPSGKSEATEFGSAVHHALQLLFEKMQSNNNIFPNPQEFISDFLWFMHRHRESFTKEQFERRIEYGKDVLANYYENYIRNFNKVVAVERNIRNIVVNGVPLKGKVDKLEFDGKAVNVVDYKTGDVTKVLAKLQGPNEKDADGGSYWRQAVFYKILVDNIENKDWRVVSSEFDFIEPDNKKVYRKEKVIICDSDVAIVTRQISTVWEKIHNRDFYKGCGKDYCYWCNFVKTNNLNFACTR